MLMTNGQKWALIKIHGEQVVDIATQARVRIGCVPLACVLLPAFGHYGGPWAVTWHARSQALVSHLSDDLSCWQSFVHLMPARSIQFNLISFKIIQSESNKTKIKYMRQGTRLIRYFIEISMEEAQLQLRKKREEGRTVTKTTKSMWERACSVV